MGNGALPHGPSDRAHPRLYHLGHSTDVRSTAAFEGNPDIEQISPCWPSLTHSRLGAREIRRRDLMERRRERHSGLMLAARITLPHFSVSSAMSLLKSAGEPTNAVPPSSASRALILGSARPALISWLSLPMISVGVFLGVPIATNALASKPGRNSPSVGTFGS